MVPSHSDEELLGEPGPDAGAPAARRSARARALLGAALLAACCGAALAAFSAAPRGAARSSSLGAPQQKSWWSDLMRQIRAGGIEPGSGGAENFACGHVPATNVFDVQWSGDQTEQVQACSWFQEPFDPRTGSRLRVDLQNDYFELVPNKSGGHSLRQFDKHGKLKFNLWGGEVKLANADVVFYIIDGWYGTIITRSSSYKYGDSATYTGLTLNPAVSCVRSKGMVNAADVEEVVYQATSDVNEAQSQ